MNFRLTAALFAAIFVLGAVLLVLSFLDDSSPATDTIVEELAAAAVKPDEVDTVEIERPGTPGKLVFKRAGADKWVIDEPIKAAADRFAVEGVVSALFRAKPTSHPELSGNATVHALEPPGLRVTLRRGDKSSAVNIGNVSPGGSKAVAFVTTSARKRPMAVPRSAVDALLRDPAATGRAGDNAKWTADYRAKQVFEARRPDDVTAVKLTKGKDTLELANYADGWKFVSPKDWGGADVVGDTNPAATGFTGVTPLLTALTGLQALSADDFIEKPDDLKPYGLEAGNPDAVRVEVKTKDGTQVVFVGKAVPPTQPPAQGTTPPPTNKWFVRVDGESGVIRASGSKLEGLAGVVADPNPIRDRTLLAVSKERIDALDLTFGGQTVKLRKTGGVPQWRMYGGPGDPPLADARQVEAMLGVLTERRSIRDFPAVTDKDVTGDQLKVEVKLWADGIEVDPKADPKAEPKLKGNPVTIQIGRQDGDKFLTRRTLPNGGVFGFTLPERVPTTGPIPVTIDLVPTLKKDRLALLDPAVPGFSPFNATKVTVAQGANVTEVEKADDPTSPLVGKWTFAKPDPRKGKTADAETVNTEWLATLARQQAARYLSEAPTDQQLAGWGLDPKNPRMKVTVGLKGEAEKERVYLIGTETDGFVHAKLDGRAAVFLLPKVVFEKFASADLRDRTVARFDRSKVKGLRIRGWRESPDSGGKMQVREFDKKDTGWAARGSGYTADGVKLNGLLAVLDGLRAKSLVPGGPAQEQRFPPETESGFEVTLELDGGQSVTLNIGGETPDKSAYFGFSSQLPPNEQIFTTPVDALRGFKASPLSVTTGK